MIAIDPCGLFGTVPAGGLVFNKTDILLKAKSSSAIVPKGPWGLNSGYFSKDVQNAALSSCRFSMSALAAFLIWLTQWYLCSVSYIRLIERRFPYGHRPKMPARAYCYHYTSISPQKVTPTWLKQRKVLYFLPALKGGTWHFSKFPPQSTKISRIVDTKA